MAERSLAKHTFSVTLTYSDDTEESRAGAAMFRYGDVSDFLKRLRRTLQYHFGFDVGAVRFVACGEQGDRTQRCHWHILLFSSVDLCGVGRWSYYGERRHVAVTARSDIVTQAGPSAVKRRRAWSLWPHGFVVVQEPDLGGVKYAITYALKDQYRVDKSAGFNREAKSETLAAGYFRMSKNPPIGQDYLDSRIWSLFERGAVLPDVKLSVPDMDKPWFPRGAMRKRFLTGMRRINNSCMVHEGRPAPQWSTLIANCADRASDLEVLIDEQEEEESAEFVIAKGAREADGESRATKIRRRCGALAPCNECLRGYSEQALSERGIAVIHGDAGTYFRYAEDRDSSRLARDQGTLGSGINSGCLLRETPSRQKCFPQSARARGPFGQAAR